MDLVPNCLVFFLENPAKIQSDSCYSKLAWGVLVGLYLSVKNEKKKEKKEKEKKEKNKKKGGKKGIESKIR